MNKWMKRLGVWIFVCLLLFASSGGIVPGVYAAAEDMVSESEDKDRKEETQTQSETQNEKETQAQSETQGGKETQAQSETGSEGKDSGNKQREPHTEKTVPGKSKETEDKAADTKAAGVSAENTTVPIGGTVYSEQTFKAEVQAFFSDQNLGGVIAETIWTSVLEPDANKTGYNTLAGNGTFTLKNGQKKVPKKLGECNSIEDVLVNYCGPINASQKGITSIDGIERMTFAGFIDLSWNSIESIEALGKNATGEQGIQDRRSGMNLWYNPLHIFPLWLQNTANSYYTLYSVGNTYWEIPLLYLYGNAHNPQIHFEVYQPNYGSPVKYNGVSVSDKEQKILEILGISQKEIENILTSEEPPSALPIPCSGNKDGEIQIGYNYSVYFRGGSGGSIATNHFSFLNYYNLIINYISRIRNKAEVKTLGGFTFTKYHEDAGEKIKVPGAAYKLYSDPEATKPVKDGNGEELEYTTDENGTFKVSGLLAGTYYLKESNPPQGFAMNHTIYEVRIAPADVQTTIDGGYDSITPTADNARVVPDWKNLKFGTLESGDEGNNGTFKAENGQVLKSSEDTIYTSNSILTGYADSKRRIRHLKNELTVADAEKYRESSNITITLTDSKGNETDVKSGITSLKDAKAYLNERIDKGKLEGNYIVKADTTYTATDSVIAANAYKGTDKPLPVYVKLMGTKEVQGAKKEEEKLKDGEYSFLLSKNSGQAEDSDQLLPETAENDAQGEFSFSTLKFTRPGEYTYTVKEVIPKESDPGYNPDMCWDESEKTITVRVSADTKGLRAAVLSEGKELMAVTSADTTSSDGSIKTEPGVNITAQVGTFFNKYLPELTVSKTVTGAFGDRTKYFEINVEIDGYSGDALVSSGEIKDARVTFENGKITSIDVANANLFQNGTLRLKHGESLTLRRLPLGYRYTVSESKGPAEGYTVTYSGSDTDAVIDQGENISASLKPGVQSVEVENKKELIPQTGLWEGSAGKYIGTGIAFLGIAAIVFVRVLKRRGIRKEI